MNKRKLIAIGISVIAIVMAIVGYIILPDTIGIQIGMDGSVSNTAPKLAGIALPFLLCIGGSLAYLFEGETKRKKNLLIAVVGLVVFALTFIVNL